MRHRAELGEQREALFAVTIPEERGSFRRLPASDTEAFRDFLETLAYHCIEATENPVYRLFLR